jgi:hypothetical protein
MYRSTLRGLWDRLRLFDVVLVVVTELDDALSMALPTVGNANGLFGRSPGARGVSSLSGRIRTGVDDMFASRCVRESLRLRLQLRSAGFSTAPSQSKILGPSE